MKLLEESLVTVQKSAPKAWQDAAGSLCPGTGTGPRDGPDPRATLGHSELHHLPFPGRAASLGLSSSLRKHA